MRSIRRVAGALSLRARTARHRGDAVACPVCEHRFDRFKDDRNRPNALCWRCGSQERHRAQWLLLERRPELLRDAATVLHFAPEWCLRRRLSAIGGLRYVTADLDGAGVDLQLDITALDLPDGAFDLVICSHVLEHVPDDAAAMRELARVLGPTGVAFVQVPFRAGAATDEDPGADADERLRRFGQADHVRWYGDDFEDRLRAAGLEVCRVTPGDLLDADLARTLGIALAEHVWIVWPAGASGGLPGDLRGDLLAALARTLAVTAATAAATERAHAMSEAALGALELSRLEARLRESGDLLRERDRSLAALTTRLDKTSADLKRARRKLVRTKARLDRLRRHPAVRAARVLKRVARGAARRAGQQR